MVNAGTHEPVEDKYAHLDPEIAEYCRKEDEDEAKRDAYNAIDWKPATPEEFGWLAEQLLTHNILGEQIKRVGIHGDLADEEYDDQIAFLHAKVEKQGWGPFEEFEYTVIPALARRIAAGKYENAQCEEAVDFVNRNTLNRPTFYGLNILPAHIDEVIFMAEQLWELPEVREFIKRCDELNFSSEEDYSKYVHQYGEIVKRVLNKHATAMRLARVRIDGGILKMMARGEISSFKEPKSIKQIEQFDAKWNITKQGYSNV